jgi:ABC-type multidrug transport system ATPase subunit/ABC-type multidrug transport system permease subunit
MSVDAPALDGCPHCGNPVAKQAFCEGCGMRLTDEPVPSSDPGAARQETEADSLNPGSLVTDRVGVSIGATVLLRPTSLEVAPGQMVAIIGPSGAGKSTLLVTLAGVVRPSTGTVALGGDDIALCLPEVGYVPQFDTVHHHLTVSEALSFAAELRLAEGMEEEARDPAVQTAIEEVGLTHRADVRVGSLSGGERKRVSVALEIISRPRVLFLDEPTTGLDPGLELRMMELVRHQADSGRSVILVTHTTQSLHLCDRLAVMAPGGRLAYYGPPAEAAAEFGVASIEEIYTLLADPEAVLPTAPVDERPRPAVRKTSPADETRSLLPQVRTLVRRGALLMSRDRRFVMIAALQAGGLGVLTALLFKSQVFDRDASDAGQCAQLLFLMVTVTIWFGAIAGARQIVGERGVLRRELATGVRVESYLTAKACILGAVTAAQTVVFALIVLMFRPLSGGVGELFIVLLLSSWCGVALGLVVSAFAQTEDQATGLIPVMLIPQLLFGGAIVTVSQMSLPVKALSWLAMAQWAYAGAGHAVSMNARIASDTVFSQTSRYGHSFFTHPMLLTVLVLCLFLAVLGAMLFRQLQPSNGIEGALVRGSIAWWKIVIRERTDRVREAVAQ